MYPVCFLELYEAEHPEMISKLLLRFFLSLKAMPVGHPTITWARCRTDGTSRTAAAPSTGPTGACSEGGRTGVTAGTAGACPTGGDPTPISTTTSIGRTTSATISTQTRDLAIDYGSSRGEEARHCRMRNGDEAGLGLPSLLITGSSKEVVPAVGLPVPGKDGDLRMTDTHGILRMRASGEGEMRGKSKAISLSWVKG